MPVLRPMRPMRRHFALPTFPFQLVRIYDAAPATGRLLAEFDVSTAITQVLGTTQVLASTVSTTVLLNGFPAYARFQTVDGLTVLDTPYALNLNAPDPSHEVIESNPPDDTVVDFPGQWMAGTTVAFGPGDITYTP